jgi:hypothetical protein
MPPKEIVCTSCDKTTDHETQFCPSCGSENPWEEEPKYEFDNEDLPIAFPYEVKNTNWKVWDEFCEHYFGERDVDGHDIKGFPRKFPKMETCETELWFVITESLELEGPFIDKPKMLTEHGHSILIDDSKE